MAVDAIIPRLGPEKCDDAWTKLVDLACGVKESDDAPFNVSQLNLLERNVPSHVLDAS
jgi:hypothetical protein